MRPGPEREARELVFPCPGSLGCSDLQSDPGLRKVVVASCLPAHIGKPLLDSNLAFKLMSSDSTLLKDVLGNPGADARAKPSLGQKRRPKAGETRYLSWGHSYEALHPLCQQPPLSTDAGSESNTASWPGSSGLWARAQGLHAVSARVSAMSTTQRRFKED